MWLGIILSVLSCSRSPCNRFLATIAYILWVICKLQFTVPHLISKRRGIYKSLWQALFVKGKSQQMCLLWITHVQSKAKEGKKASFCSVYERAPWGSFFTFYSFLLAVFSSTVELLLTIYISNKGIYQLTFLESVFINNSYRTKVDLYSPVISIQSCDGWMTDWLQMWMQE